ncbi:MAG: hypothetical protein IPL20_06220 [Saprospiraceae bacterium]|nr:hypothetical protein [Saprospiraceae bacterium]
MKVIICNFGDMISPNTAYHIQKLLIRSLRCLFLILIVFKLNVGWTSTPVKNFSVNSIKLSSNQHSCSNQTPCIQIGNNNNSVTLLSDLINENNPIIPSYLWFGARVVRNQCFSIKGKFVIDVAIIYFVNIHCYMDSGSEVEIVPYNNASRWFIDSEFQGCSQMWRGIKVLGNDSSTFGNSAAIFLNTKIKDAWRGIEVEHNNSINIGQCSFVNNYTSLHFGKGNNYSNILMNIQGCIFENLGALLPAYDGQPQWLSRSVYGIYSEKISFLDLESDNHTTNVFKNLYFGIYIKNSNAIITKNSFIDSDNFFTNGIAIDQSSNIINIKNNSFIDVYNGVRCTNSNGTVINIENNSFLEEQKIQDNSIGNGINMSSMNHSNVNVLNNNFTYHLSGCLYSLGTRFTFENNDITFTKLNTDNTYVCHVFGVHEKSSINNNSINIQNFGSQVYFYALSTIRIENSSYIEILDNTYSFDSNNDNKSSVIALLGTKRFLVKNNKLFLPVWEGFLAFGTEQDEVNAFCCNESAIIATFSSNENRPSNFKFFQNYSDISIKQNKMQILQSVGYTGMQHDAGNLWEGSNSMAALGSISASLALQNQFKLT